MGGNGGGGEKEGRGNSGKFSICSRNLQRGELSRLISDTEAGYALTVSTLYESSL